MFPGGGGLPWGDTCLPHRAKAEDVGKRHSGQAGQMEDWGNTRALSGSSGTDHGMGLPPPARHTRSPGHCPTGGDPCPQVLRQPGRPAAREKYSHSDAAPSL